MTDKTELPKEVREELAQAAEEEKERKEREARQERRANTKWGDKIEGEMNDE